jgi:hypothetical protein
LEGRNTRRPIVTDAQCSDREHVMVFRPLNNSTLPSIWISSSLSFVSPPATVSLNWPAYTRRESGIHRTILFPTQQPNQTQKNTSKKAFLPFRSAEQVSNSL